jgi:hypothetical protein
MESEASWFARFFDSRQVMRWETSTNGVAIHTFLLFLLREGQLQNNPERLSKAKKKYLNNQRVKGL